MTSPREYLRSLLSEDRCHLAAPIFDPLSARIADCLGWRLCKLSGSVGKYANLAVPDGVPLANMSDLVEVCRRITRVADVSLIVDADDAGGSVFSTYRAIRELEASGVAAIEIEDNSVPPRFVDARHSFMISKEQHVGKLRAALDARRNPDTVIVARTTALFTCERAEALERIDEYSQTGVDALMFPGLGPEGISANPRADLEAVHDLSGLPIFVSGLPRDLVANETWLRETDIRVRFSAQAPFRMAVRAIHDALSHLQAGGSADDLRERWASADVVAEVTRDETYRSLETQYLDRLR